MVNSAKYTYRHKKSFLHKQKAFFAIKLPAVAHALNPLDDIELFSSDFIFEIK